MTLATRIGALRERALAYWTARTAQERRFLAAGGVVIVAALLYLVLLEPAIDGRDRLQRALPQLRQQSAQLQAMAEQARALASQPAASPAAAPGLLTREVLAASMTARGLDPATLSMSGELITLQLNDVLFANLVAWLDEVGREHRVQVQEAQVSSQGAPGHVAGTLTLRRMAGPAA